MNELTKKGKKQCSNKWFSRCNRIVVYNGISNIRYILLIMMIVLLASVTVCAEPNSQISSATKNTETTKKNSEDVLVIPADNKYFPNMTLTEIKKWYVIEVNKFIESGGTTKNGWTYTFDEYKNDVRNWAKWVFKKKENQMEIAYDGCVEVFNKDDTKEFYQVQKKIYDFIKEYQEEKNVLLNFENWENLDEVETTTEVPNTTVDNRQEVTTIAEETSSEDNNGTTEVTIASQDDDNEAGNTILDALKDAWLTILILIVVLVAGIVWKVKYNKSKNI